jgi:hypothetical protein
MSGEKIEGTIVLDGLVQGRLPLAGDQVPQQLKQWVQFVGGMGVRFSLEIRDAAFNLLPDDRATSVKLLGDPPEHALEQALTQLAELFTGPERAQLFSTLRSSEFRPGEEVQTVYTIIEGRPRIQSRTLPAQTTPPVEPLSIKERVKLGAIGLAMAVILLGIALLFPGVRAMFGQVAEIVKPLDTGELKIDVGPYAPYFSCTIDEKQSDRTALVLRLKRVETFPRDEAALNAQLSAADQSISSRLALENLARGHIRVELFDADDKYLASAELRIADLRKQETLDVKLPLPEKTRTQKIVFVP